MKKRFAVLLALTLILSLTMSLFAATVSAASWTGAITIEGTNTVPVTNKTFGAYKVLDAKAVNEGNLDAGVVYSIPAALKGFYDDLCGGNDNIATVDEVIAYIKANTDSFAAKALAAAKKAGITPVTSEANGDTAVIDELPFGYYVIEDMGTATPISALMLRSTSETVKIKADKPFITKKIDGDNDGDRTTGDLVDYNTATVGETVPYVLTSRVPVMEGYTAYTYTVTDTFSDGLTLIYDAENNTGVTVTVGGEAYTDFTVAVNGQTMTIDFPHFINLKDKANAEIVIKYAATVNENAIIGIEGNPNEVYLTYSNNPNATSTEDTLKDIVYTYLMDLIINKTDKNDTPLPGAQFDIKHNGVVIASGTSNEDGVVNFTWVNGVGLKDGETYVIEETEAPAGYNKASDIEFTVTCTDPVADAANANCTWTTNNNKVTATITDGTAADYFETTVINTTGLVLPETGGIGTTIFYVVGTLLMIGAAVLLVSKKRMGGAA